ncbi:MAG: FAD-dependent monooxygenase, partial [Hyphomicrobiaceae bacterium]|nr:FAD-dependent monooxygenase [Hyphomicrobiaceae bacterium]
ELSAATTTGLWLAPGAHVVHYPVRGSTEIAIVVVITAHEPCDGWSTAATSETVAAATASLNAPLRALIAAAPSWGVWSLYDLPSRSPWSRGRIVLLGDAAHPMLPFLAQGAVMALEDALSLAAVVTPVVRDGGPLQPALSAFEARRRSRVQQVIATARRNGTIYHLSGPAAFARDVVLRATPGHRLIEGYDWLYGHDPTRGPTNNAMAAPVAGAEAAGQ